MKYREYNDYELLYMVNEMSEEALDILYEKYKPIIIKTANKYFSTYRKYGLDINDFILEGYVALDKAIKKYETLLNDNISFSSFLVLTLERQMKDLVRKVKAQKNKILNDSIYYEDINEQNDLNYLDLKADDNSIEPLNLIINNEQQKEIINTFTNKLKGIELKVFNLKKIGYTNIEIANKLNINIKSVLNAVSRIKKKGKENIDFY